jgi:hypothetical protein
MAIDEKASLVSYVLISFLAVTYNSNSIAIIKKGIA